MVLAPLHKAFGLEWVQLTSMQAVSGAGYPGVSSYDIIGNVIPFIGGEEPKVEVESQKILGTIEGNTVKSADFIVSARVRQRTNGGLVVEQLSVLILSKWDRFGAVLADVMGGDRTSPE